MFLLKESSTWSPAIENDGYVYTGRGGSIQGVQSKEKVWIDLDAIGLTFGPENDPQTNAQERIDGNDFGIELVGDGVSTVDIVGLEQPANLVLGLTITSMLTV